MKTILDRLGQFTGSFEGEGINHEGQPFNGKLSLRTILGGLGFSIHFIAQGRDGSIYHEEESMIAPSIDQKLTLWNFNTNTPGLVAHELRSATEDNLVFGFNNPSDSSKFREEIALRLWPEGSVSYTYFWGMPGGEFKERSGVRMKKVENAL